MAAVRQILRLRQAAAQLTQQQKFQAALARLAEARRLAPTVFGRRHGWPAQITAQMADVLETAGNWCAAAKTYDEVIRLWLVALDVKEHDPIARALMKKGEALIRCGKKAQAITVLIRALAMWHRVAKLPSGRYGPYYVFIKREGAPVGSIATCTIDLARAYMITGKLDKADALFQRAMADVKGIQMPMEFQVQLNIDLSYLYQLSGRFRAAVPREEAAAAVLARAGRGARPMHIRSLLRLAELHLANQDFTRAQQTITKAQSLRASQPRVNKLAAFHANVLLARSFLGLKRLDDAEALLKSLASQAAQIRLPSGIRARFHATWARLWLAKKRPTEARAAGDRLLAALHETHGVGPLTIPLYALVGRTRAQGPRFTFALVAWWGAVQEGARTQPSGKALKKEACRLKTALGKRRVQAQLGKARAEAKAAAIRPAGLPACP